MGRVKGTGLTFFGGKWVLRDGTVWGEKNFGPGMKKFIRRDCGRTGRDWHEVCFSGVKTT